MNAKQRDLLLAEIEKLLAAPSCLDGTPYIPVHRDTLTAMLAALVRCKAIEDGD